MKISFLLLLLSINAPITYSQGIIDSLALLKEETIKEASNFSDQTEEGLHRYKNFKSYSGNPWSPNDVYITIDGLTVQSGWGDTRFVFYQGELNSAILHFELIPNSYKAKIYTNSLPDTVATRMKLLFKDSLSKNPALWSNGKYEVTYFSRLPKTDYPEIIFENKSVTAKIKKQSGNITDSSKTLYSSWASFAHTDLWGTEIKIGEFYITDKPKVVPKGVIWKLIRIYGSGYSSDKVGVFIDEIGIPVNYFDITRDIGYQDTISLKFNLIKNLNYSAAMGNIEMGSFPISTMPLTFFTGYKLRTASPTIKMLVYIYKYSKKQLDYLNQK